MRTSFEPPMEDPPRKMPDELVLPVPPFESNALYCSNDANRIAILGTMPVTTAPSPLYNPSGLSFETMCAPVAMKPRALVCRRRSERESAPW